MLHVSARIDRRFELPVRLAVAEAHFRDFRQTLPDLPELDLTAELGPGQYRVRYRATVRGVYQVELFTDIAAHYDDKAHALVVTALEGHEPVRSEVTLRSMKAHGRYASRLALAGKGVTTQVHYELAISADLPKPQGLRLLPDKLAAMAIEKVMQGRAEASTNAFIDRTRQRLAPAEPA
mgnify:CR=1 FL=1